MWQQEQRLRSCMIGLIIGLLLVGYVSGTPLRHVVQVLPACVALLLLRRGPSWSPYAALPIFFFWLLLMALIWLHLFGVAHAITGHFSWIEIVLTVFIALWSLFGMLNFFRISSQGQPRFSGPCLSAFSAGSSCCALAEHETFPCPSLTHFCRFLAERRYHLPARSWRPQHVVKLSFHLHSRVTLISNLP
jgi:hypothetical protein